MVDIIFARSFTDGMILHLKDVICEHLHMYLELYGAYGVKLRPKHHLLVHLPSVVTRSGPLISMSCMKYELKNSFFKRCDHTVCSFTNICKTLAFRHQQHALFTQLSNGHIRNCIPSVGRLNFESVCSLLYFDEVIAYLGLSLTDDVAVSTTVCIESVEYRQGHFVMLHVDTELGVPVLGKVVGFVSPVVNECWHIVVESVETKLFLSHFHAYEVAVTQPSIFSLIKFQELVAYQPLYCHSVLTADNARRSFVRLPHHVF